jgi:hypothetical protein
MSPRTWSCVGPDPLAADLDDGAVGKVMVQHTAPDPISCLEDGDVHSGLAQQPGGTQSGQTCTNDHDLRHDASSF